MNYTIGIDLGGTKIKAGVISQNGQVMFASECATPADGEAILAAMIDICRPLCEQWEIAAVGLGSPGLIAYPSGEVLGCTPNLNAWQGRALKQDLSRALNKPVVVDNDANVACYGECAMGGHLGARLVIALTLGTGLGSGVMMAGKMHRGYGRFGIGFGHMIVEHRGRWCNCGQQGCLEAYVSGRGLSKTYSLLGGEVLKGEQIFEQAAAGESLALAAVDNFLTYLAVGVSNILNTLAPEQLILGGGMSRQGEKRLLLPLKEKVKGIMGMPFEPDNVLSLAVLGADAGLIGAGLMALEEEVVQHGKQSR